MSKKFDKAIAEERRHKHQCRKCGATIYCSAAPCEFPEWTECADCRKVK